MQLTLDGVRLDVLDEGSGPAIVLIHGVLLSKATWDAQAAALARSARVVRFDLRGHGRSSAPPGPYLMETLAGDVAAVLDVLEIERATVVGHSLGGYVTFAFYRLFAERCRGLGFVSTRAAADDRASARARHDLAERVDREGIAAAADAYRSHMFAPQTYATHPELTAQLEAIMVRTDPSGAAATFRGIAERVSSEDLYAEIDVPVRIVAGTADAVIPFSFSQAMAAGIPGAALDVLACGHVPLYEEPDELTASLERLLAASV